MGIGSIFNSVTAGARDAVVEAGAVQWIKSQTKAVREVRHFRIDSTNKTAQAEVELAGEPHPVTFEIGRYQVSEQDGQCFIEVSDLRSSKEWLAILASEHLCNRKLPVPSAVRRFL